MEGHRIDLAHSCEDLVARPPRAHKILRVHFNPPQHGPALQKGRHMRKAQRQAHTTPRSEVICHGLGITPRSGPR